MVGEETKLKTAKPKTIYRKDKVPFTEEQAQNDNLEGNNIKSSFNLPKKLADGQEPTFVDVLLHRANAPILPQGKSHQKNDSAQSSFEESVTVEWSHHLRKLQNNKRKFDYPCTNGNTFFLSLFVILCLTDHVEI